MALAQDFEQLATAKGVDAAVSMVRERAAQDDAAALFTVAQWRLWGLHGPRDVADGYALAARAAALGHEAAGFTHAALTANGTGTAADFAGALEAVRAMASRSPRAASQVALVDGWAPGHGEREQHSKSPSITTYRDFAPDGVCRHVAARAAPHLKPSRIVDPITKVQRPHPIRTSHGANFAPGDEDIVLHLLHRRIAEVTNTDVAQGEPLQVLTYAPGQEYRLHHDALAGLANQRIWTSILYLNDGFEAGTTVFPELGLEITPRAGSLLVFANTDQGGQPDPRTRHAGQPVRMGQKWVATRWIRQRRCHPFEPDTMA